MGEKTIRCHMGLLNHIQNGNGEMPFSLTYNIEPIIPVETRLPSYRTSVENLYDNKEGLALALNLDLLQRKREHNEIRLVAYQKRMTNHNNCSINPWQFQ